MHWRCNLVTLQPVTEIPFGQRIGHENEYLDGQKTTDIVDPNKFIPRPASSGTSFSIYSVEGQVYVSHGAASYKVEGLVDVVRIEMVRRGLQAQMGRVDESIKEEYTSLDVRLQTKHRMLDSLHVEDERLREIQLSARRGQPATN